MSKEFGGNPNEELADLREWANLKKSLSGIPAGFVPDTSFADLPEEGERQYQEPGLSKEQLAYMLRFNRTDAHVLFTLLTAHTDLGGLPEMVRFANAQSLNGQVQFNRETTHKIMRELERCVYGGIERTYDEQGRRPSFSHNPMHEMLVSHAGYLYRYSRDKDVQLRDLIGPAASGDVRDRQILVDNEEVGFTLDRINVINALREQWSEVKYAPQFMTTQSQLAADIGRPTPRVARHVADLSDAKLLVFTPSAAEAPNNQHYTVKQDVRAPRKQEASTVSDYVREYIFSMQTDLNAHSAVDFIFDRHQHLQELPDAEQQRIRSGIFARLYDNVAELLVRDGGPSKSHKATISMPEGKRHFWLKEYAETLDVMQREDKNSIERGLELGRAIVQDREGMTALIGKIVIDNERFKRK